MTRFVSAVAFFVVGLSFSTGAMGDQITPEAAPTLLEADQTELEAALRGLAAAAEGEAALSPEFKSALQKVITGLREQERRRELRSELPAVGMENRGFLDRLHPYADMRLRFEHDGSRPGAGDRNRLRARLRIGANYDITETVTAGFRISTGDSDDPNSSNQTFGSMFDSWQFDLDRAFLKYSPEWLKGAWLIGGKFDNPFVTSPVYGELVWDGDVNPEGVAGGYTWSRDGMQAGFSTAGYIPVQGGDDSATIFATQLFARNEWSDHLSSMLAIGFTNYEDLHADEPPPFESVGDNPGGIAGNDIVGDRYRSDFGILNPIASITCDCLGWPLTLSGEYIYNTRAKGNRDDGYSVGTSTKFPLFDKNHNAFYQYQRIERDAVFAAFAQDDFTQSSNFKGHVLGFDWQLAGRINLRTWALFTKPIQNEGVSDKTQTRLRTDINVKF
ncbi:MAG: putative porin [Deltaproteobacteria bacterium]|nr:putative porin [Deltaproteobacteria bacterium]